MFLTRRENALLGNIFAFLCCTCDTKHTCKRSFWLTQASFSESDVNMSKFPAEFIAVAARKPQFYFLSDSSKSKTLWQVLVLVSKIVHQRVSPDKIWRNLWFQFWKSILDIYSPLVLSNWKSTHARIVLLICDRHYPEDIRHRIRHRNPKPHSHCHPQSVCINHDNWEKHSFRDNTDFYIYRVSRALIQLL